MTSAHQLCWPADRIGEALEFLGRESGLTHLEAGAATAHRPPTAVIENNNGHLQAWIAATAEELGLEAEPVEASYANVDELVSGAAPAVFRLPGEGTNRYLAVVRSRRNKLHVLTPQHHVVALSPEVLAAELRQPAEENVNDRVDELLERAGLSGRQRQHARTAVLREVLGPLRIEAGWMLRTAPHSNLKLQAREFGLPGLLTKLVVFQATYYALWLLSWAIIGGTVLQGRLDAGWLTAWALVLLTLIPFRILVTHTEGTLACRASTLLKRRVLFGALCLNPDEIRRQGAGHLLGRVLEADVLDSMALTGGFLSLTAMVELLFAAGVLGFGAGGWLHVLLLIAAGVLAAVLAVKHYHRRRAWTSHRFEMINGLVERMVGHRTRLAQEPRERWNDDEDRELEQYVVLSGDMDRTTETMKVVVPRIWFLAGLVGLAPAFVYEDPTVVGLGIAIGGVILAYRAFQNFAEGLDRVASACIAWERVKIFWEAVEESKAVASGALLAAVAQSSHHAPRDESRTGLNASRAHPSTHNRPLLQARGLNFQYPTRHVPVLQNVDLEVHAGDQLLLEGASGGGKSTLAAILAALRKPDAGLVLFRGLDRQTLGEQEWRRHVVLAPQFHENHVLMGTLAFNLLMGRRWPPRPEDVHEAERVCHAVGLGPLLSRMPSGLQQMVGETGWQLSHGEKSRVYIARTLLQGAEVVILDESFAALDAETLDQTLKSVLNEAKTLVVIAHP